MKIFWSYLALILLSFIHLGQSRGGSASLKRLLKALFEDSGYDTLVRPCQNYSEPMEVEVEAVFNTVLNLDLKQQIMRTTGFFRVQWIDDHLKWDPEMYDDIEKIIIPQNKLWHPDVAYYNTVQENRYPGSHGTLVSVSSRGEVYWVPAFNLDTACKFDVTKYPFDSNICSVRVFSWMNDNTSVRLNLGAIPVQFEFLLQNGEYTVEAEDSFKLTFHSNRTNLHYEELMFQLKLSRRPGYFILSLLMPVMLLAIMCSTSFLLAPDEQDKLTVAITVLLSFTVFLGVIDQDMPKTSDNISLLVVYVTCMLAVGFLCVLGNVIVIKCDRWEADRDRAASARKGDVISLATPSARNDSNDLLQGLSNNQSDVLITESDKMSDKSGNTRPNGHRPSGGRIGLFKCKKPKFSKILNRGFFALNLTIVISLTVLMWVLMLI